MPNAPLKLDVIQHFIARHLDLYLPSSINDMLLGLPVEPPAETIDTADEDFVKIEEVDAVDESADVDLQHRRRTMESVIEEDEEDI